VADFSGLVGKVFLADQISRGTIEPGGGKGGYLFAKTIALADVNPAVGTYGADAKVTFTQVYQDGNFLAASATITSSNFIANGKIFTGTFLANDTASFILNAQQVPGFGSAFLYFTNTAAQQPGTEAPNNTVVVPDFLNNVVYTPPACFCEGTRIATTRGDVAVELLKVGDDVVTASGRLAPVLWLGHRRVNCARHPHPHDVMPVRIAAGAFGPGLPRADVRLSPDHAVFVDDVLIPVRHLVNGTGIARDTVAAVTYWHVELDRHDVILAEGLPCESFLDTGRRGSFATGGAAVVLHPDVAARLWDAEACAPLVVAGPRLERVRAALRWRLAA
jgi:hypothetical protein